MIWLFAAAAVLFVTSKPQHAPLAIFPAAFLVSLPRRRHSLAAAALVSGAAIWLIASVSEFYPSQPLFSVIFFKLAPSSPAPEAAVREVGLGPAEYRYIGSHAFSGGSPVGDLAWLRDFNRRTSTARVMMYWLRHPRVAWNALEADLQDQAPDLRQQNLSNYRREDGHPPGALTNRFALWSNLRSALYRRWPNHILFWYAAVIVVAAANLRKHRTTALLCLGIAAMALLEFCFACLTDATETARHLFLFHVLTEVTICFAAAWIFKPGTDGTFPRAFSCR
jgi:hypothetical protein